MIMKNIRLPIFVTTLYLFIYALTPYFAISSKITIAMFLLSPFLMAWMVLSILIKGESSTKKFSDGHWYEDVNKVYSKDS